MIQGKNIFSCKSGFSQEKYYVNEEQTFEIPAVKYFAREIFPLIQTEIRIHSSCKFNNIGAWQMSQTEPEKWQITSHLELTSLSLAMSCITLGEPIFFRCASISCF